MKQNIFYHCTSAENLRSIFKNGLLISKPKGSAPASQRAGVYFCKYPFAWMFWETLDRKPGLELSVNMHGIKLYQDLAHAESVYAKHNTEKERIVNFKISTKKDPCRFKQHEVYLYRGKIRKEWKNRSCIKLTKVFRFPRNCRIMFLDNEEQAIVPFRCLRKYKQGVD